VICGPKRMKSQKDRKKNEFWPRSELRTKSYLISDSKLQALGEDEDEVLTEKKNDRERVDISISILCWILIPKSCIFLTIFFSHIIEEREIYELISSRGNGNL
jgi:hypothetical protein